MSTQLEASHSRLNDLADEIREEVMLAERTWRDAVSHAIRAGEKLIEAKALVKHGEWLPWLESGFPGSERTAQGYMRMAKSATTVADLPSIREAIAQLTEPREKVEQAPPAGPRLTIDTGDRLRVLQVENAMADVAKVIAGGESAPRLSRSTVEAIKVLAEGVSWA